MIKIRVSIGENNVYIFQSVFTPPKTVEKISASEIAAIVATVKRRCLKSARNAGPSVDELIAIKAAIMAYEADAASSRLIAKPPVMSTWKLAARIRM